VKVEIFGSHVTHSRQPNAPRLNVEILQIVCEAGREIVGNAIQEDLVAWSKSGLARESDGSRDHAHTQGPRF
jgi:hypothetical protein